MDAIHLHSPAGGGLFAAEDRSVNTYPSGLCRVDQTYYCPATDAAAARTTLAIGQPMPDGDETPAIDGLAIFPTPAELGGQYGMKEFRVSAYGRTADTLQNIQLEQQRVIANSNVTYGLWKITGAICIPTTTSFTIEDLGLDPNLLEPFDFYFVSNPLLDTLNVEQIEVTTPARSRTVQSVSVGGKTFDIIQPGAARRKYRVQMTLDGTTVSATADFWVTDPIFRINSSRAFGNFAEMEITTERQNTDPVLS